MTPAPHHRSMRRRRLASRLVTGAVVTMLSLVLASCGDGVSPGVAAEVDDVSISVDEVDDLATMICQIDVGAGQPGKPMSAQRGTALTVLLSITVGRQIGEVDQVPREQVSQSLEAASDAREYVSDDLKPYFDEVVTESTRSAAALDAVAVQNLVERGEQPSQETVPPEVAQIQADYLEEHPVELDPRFGVFQNGQVVNGNGSISIPVSETARSFIPQSTDSLEAAPPSADLPPSQVCS